MNDRNFDLIDFIEGAWRTYQADLAAFVAEMPDGEELTVSAESGVDRRDGDTPWIRVSSGPDGEIRSDAALGRYLYDGIEPPVGDDEKLGELGWATPGERDVLGVKSCSLQCNRSDAADLAERIVTAFRSVWHVTHPAFLSADAEGGSGRQFRTAADPRRTDSTALVPLDIDHLRALMIDTLRGAGIDISQEDNGDIAIGGFALPLHVCLGPDATAVRLHAPLVTGVRHSTALSRKMAWLGTRWKEINFVVAGGQLFAGVDVTTRTFVPRHLTAAIYSLGLFVDRIDTRFASELGGTVFDPDHTHPDALAQVTWSDDSGTLGTLRAACELTGGPVDTATVDALCRRQDLAELTERALWSAERFRGRAHRLGDERRLRAAVLCDKFAAAWEDVAASLKRAARPAPAPVPRGEQTQLFLQFDQPSLFDVRVDNSPAR
ncbi:hypothetical protein CH293_19005 [Rhodococcus sp. 14-2470-1b]|uniref:T3SS (YopN, CesT) and YbjN peptide-binding chaperone 1 n=1 Tax=Rhodococcus sp. 14-2470-1b TaxID=2023149 RepID=UPI000B9C375D|nr:hypothetical protein [Rhodococcus sp. 14-2470-1b]OZF48389.1 hypothetical protein CH293_19005 [Rhodococcus sp. 14-2470-1b]